MLFVSTKVQNNINIYTMEIKKFDIFLESLARPDSSLKALKRTKDKNNYY